MNPYLSIEQLAQETELEESLIRYYESEYALDLPPKLLKGGTLFFDPSAVSAFKKVHEDHLHKKAEHTPALAHGRQRYARVIAITSGKGGVGKSNVALNLAISFQRAGKMVVVVDADLGMANIHLLAGIQPSYTLKDLLKKDVTASDIIAQGPEGIGIVPGGSGVVALADASPAERLRMIAALKDMERAADIILVDTGAGMSPGVRDFLRVADDVLFVLSPDITSLADAYGLLKALCQQESVRAVSTVVNMVTSLQQAADIASRFSNCVGQFLDKKVTNVGYLMKDSTVGAATAKRMPFSIYDAQARVSKNVYNIALELLKQQGEQVVMHSSFQRYMNLLMDCSQ